MAGKYPYFVEELREVDKDLFNIVSQNMDLANKEGELDAKTKVLITLALDALVNSGEGVKHLANVARKLGATDQEIKETIRIAYMVSSNKTLIAGLNAFSK